MKKLTIIGASGHGKVVASIALLNGYDEIEFLDDNEAIVACGNYPVIGKSKLALKIENDIFVAIGNCQIRKKIMERLADRNMPVLIHPNATVAEGVLIGKGTVVVAGAVINSDAIIGKGGIVNTCSSVGHDCTIGDYVHVAPGAHVCGTSQIGNVTWIGAGTIVSNNVLVCNNCMIGAGTVIIKDLKESGTYIGTPAKLVKTNGI